MKKQPYSRAAYSQLVGLAVVALVAIPLVALASSWPAARPRPATTPAGEAGSAAADSAAMDCAKCHACAEPTETTPCLRECPRPAPAPATANNDELPDDVLLLDAFDWEDRRFMAVPFTHKSHADMANMGDGCETCHHHSTPGEAHPNCSVCHKATFSKDKMEDMRMPSLKGAYHRQCMGCHRTWAHNTKCSACHLPKGNATKSLPVNDLLNHGDIAGAHPPLDNPEHILRKVDYEDGPNVMFRHREHIERYGFECERCHRDESCAQCHERSDTPRERVAGTGPMTHDGCFNCHGEDTCERCHSTEETPSPKHFDHASTGFALQKHHGELSCRACHKRLLFARDLDHECATCHTDWDADSFDHSLTGQVLDDNHEDADCTDCHEDGQFAPAPSCSECHDEDIKFPKMRPGPIAQADAPKEKTG